MYQISIFVSNKNKLLIGTLFFFCLLVSITKIFGTNTQLHIQNILCFFFFLWIKVTKSFTRDVQVEHFSCGPHKPNKGLSKEVEIQMMVLSPPRHNGMKTKELIQTHQIENQVCMHLP